MFCFPCFGSGSKDEKPLKRNESSTNSSVHTRNNDNNNNLQDEKYEKQSSRAPAATAAAATATSNNPQNQVAKAASEKVKPRQGNDGKKDDVNKEGEAAGIRIAAQTFHFRELAAATNNFRSDCFLGEGGFGRVYKGTLQSTGQVVAVKQLDRNGLQGNREFLVEVLMLSLLHHPNLVNLIGYCADGDQRLLVYEYMPLGSLEDHLHDLLPDKESLEWNTRMKIAAGAAKGLEHLHAKANPPVIYRDFKSSNILLDEGFHPKLSDFGLAKLGPVGDKTHVSTRVMGTYGYCAPEYAMTGQLTVKSDVYSFGVVLLELITGRKAIDNTRPTKEQNLVNWARPLFKDRRKFAMMADPLLKSNYPMRGLYQALAVAAMCLQDEATSRPLMGDVVTALSYLSAQTYDPGAHPVNGARHAASAEKKMNEKKGNDTGSDRDSDKGNKRGSARYQFAMAENSPERRAARVKTLNGLAETGGSQEGSGKDSGDSDRSDGAKDSPKILGRVPREGGRRFLTVSEDRQRALAEAKSWGENFREKNKGSSNNVGNGSR